MLAALYSYISRSSARVMTEIDGRVCHEAALPADASQQQQQQPQSRASKRKAAGV
jgi:hypothetical protein